MADKKRCGGAESESEPLTYTVCNRFKNKPRIHIDVCRTKYFAPHSKICKKCQFWEILKDDKRSE